MNVYTMVLSVQIQDEARTKVRKCLTLSSTQSALQRIMPFPCKKQYTAVILMPQKSRLESLTSFFRSTQTTYGRQAKVSYISILSFQSLKDRKR